jgi:sulfofructose kinase
VGDVRWLEGVRTVFTQARKDRVPTLLDAVLGAREALPGLLQLTDYAIFSGPALRDLIPAAADDAERLAQALAMGPRHAGVTLGGEGYLWRELAGGTPTAPERVPAFRIAVTDTTGAGDAFHGTFALMLAEGRPVAACARLAAAAAALKCTRLGSRAGLPLRAELEAFERSRP